MKSRVWSVKFGVNVACKVRNVDYKVKVWSGLCGVYSVESVMCRVWSAKCEVWSWDCGNYGR